MDPLLQKEIEEIINCNQIVVFIKGSREQPRCGFSNTVIQILDTLNLDYKTIDVLSCPGIREGIKEYSKWPTIPQIYIKGEFLGGADIILELYKTKMLQEMVEALKHS
jgi:monothiol glutaredoxin